MSRKLGPESHEFQGQVLEAIEVLSSAMGKQINVPGFQFLLSLQG